MLKKLGLGLLLVLALAIVALGGLPQQTNSQPTNQPVLADDTGHWGNGPATATPTSTPDGHAIDRRQQVADDTGHWGNGAATATQTATPDGRAVDRRQHVADDTGHWGEGHATPTPTPNGQAFVRINR